MSLYKLLLFYYERAQIAKKVLILYFMIQGVITSEVEDRASSTENKVKS